MTLAELRKKLQEILKRLKAFRALKAEERTEEIRATRDADMAESKTIETEIRELEEEAALEERMNRTISGQPPEGDDFSDDANVDVPDQEIYRGDENRALGAQIRDAIVMITGRGNSEILQRASQRYNDNRTREIRMLERDQPEFRAAGTGQVQGIASEGGMFLTGSVAVDIMDRGFNNTAVLPRCRRVTLGAGEAWADLIDIDETSRATGSRQGGIRVYTEAELGTYSESMTKFRKIRVEPKKLTGLLYLSEEMDMNAPLMGQEVSRLFMNDFAFKMQDQVIEGTGAGQAMGIKGADVSISIDKETDQAALSIVTPNILAMIERFEGTAPIWVYNKNCFSQLMQMTYDVGTGGVLSKLFSPPLLADGIGTIWGFPAIPIEQAETCGTAGDLWLADFSKYIVADKGDVLQSVSIHVKFLFGQIALRFTKYFDGRPRHESPLTPFKDSVTGHEISPFVNIAVRA